MNEYTKKLLHKSLPNQKSLRELLFEVALYLETDEDYPQSLADAFTGFVNDLPDYGDSENGQE